MHRTAGADGDDLGSCRELLRHLNHPRRLRENAIVQRILKSGGQDGAGLSDTVLAEFVLRAVEFALDGLSTRQQAIVLRCNIGGERYADVARSLSISERHAFRERDAAVRGMLERFVPGLPVARTRVSSADDGLWLQVAHAQALEHNGNWRPAADVLERLGSVLPDADRRCFVETRLAHLYREAECFANAEHHLNVARQLAARVENRRGWQLAEVEVAAARLADATGDSRGAGRLARRACAELQSWAHTTAERRIRNALIDGLTLCSEEAFGEDDLAAARFAYAACEAIGNARFIDPQFVIAARDGAAMAGWVHGRDSRVCELELRACYSLATQDGLTRQAVVVAAHIAGCLRIAGRSRAAMEFLTPLVAIARIVGTGEPAAALIFELVMANLESRDLETARLYLAELRERAVANPLTQGCVEFVAAKTALAQRNYALALRCSEAAESIFMRLGKGRFVGASLRRQTEALLGLGQRERALKTIKLEIELLTAGRSHPTRLVEAYRILSRLSGNAKYAATARRLLASR